MRRGDDTESSFDADRVAAQSRSAASEVDEDVDPEDLRYALRPPRRFKWLRRIAVLVVLLLVLAGLGWVAYDWSQKQYYVAEDDGVVTIFKGVDLDLPLLSMNEVVEHSDITMEALPDFRASQVREGIAAGTQSPEIGFRCVRERR